MFYCQVMQELEQQEENERNKENEFPSRSLENPVSSQCE
nr:MAG TPA: hypothetical protein [Caudoviricetes sp.]